MGFDCEAFESFIATEQVTHVLVPTRSLDAARACRPLAELYEGEDFAVFEVAANG